MEASQRELARATEELGRLQVQGGGDWYGRFMAVEVLYKDQDSRVQILEAELRRKSDACAEERAVRKMLEQQYASLKKKVGSQISGSFPYMGVLRSDIPSTSLGSVAHPPPSTKRGHREEGGSGAPPQDSDGGEGGVERGGES